MIKAVDVEEVVLGSILWDSTVKIIVTPEAFTRINKDIFDSIDRLKQNIVYIESLIR